MTGATQQTVLRLSHDRHRDWWDRKHAVEKWIIHTKFAAGNPELKCEFVIFRRGWRVKGQQYEDLDLRVTTVIVFRSENYVFFASSLPVPLHIMHRAPKSCVLKLFAKFVLFVRSHFDLTCHVARCCCC